MPPSPSFLSMRYGPSLRPCREGIATATSIASEKPARKTLAPASAARSSSASDTRSGSPRRSSARTRCRSPGGVSPTASKISRRRRKRSASAMELSRGRTAETAMKPALGEPPMPAYRGIGEPQDRGDLVMAQTAEKPQLDDSGERLVRFFELDQGLVQGNQAGVRLHRQVGNLVESQPDEPAAVLRVLTSPRAVDENPPHDPGGDSEEVDAVPPLDGLEIAQPHEGVVDQIARLEGRPSSLLVEVVAGEPAQVVVDQRNQLVERTLIAASPFAEQSSDAT